MYSIADGLEQYVAAEQTKYRMKFSNLASNQSPQVLFLTCSDSRILPNRITCSGPGDLYFHRNIGNMVTPYDPKKPNESNCEMAVINFAVYYLDIKEIIICGHSNCVAMQALLAGRENIPQLSLNTWLKNGEDALADQNCKKVQRVTDDPCDHLAQVNVIKQIEHLSSYPEFKSKINSGMLKIQGWWFELESGEVYVYSDKQNKFIPQSSLMHR